VTMTGRSTFWLCLFVSLFVSSLPVFAQEPRFAINNFQIVGEPPLSDSQVQHVLAIFTGKDRTLADLQSAASALEEAIKATGDIFYRVVVPPQKLDAAEVRLKVLRFTVSQVKVSGNKHFDEDNIKASIPELAVGMSPNSIEVQKSLQIANDHPAKRATILMRQSREVADSIEAEIQVQDVDPQQMFVSLNNTGNDDTGNERLSFGYQHSNLFNIDHAVTLSYTTSPGHWSDVDQKGVFYRMPFYQLGGNLTLSAVDSDVDSGVVGDFNVSGQGTFYGARYQHALRKIDDYSHSLYISAEDKDFVNDVTFFGLAIGADVRSRPLTIGYSGKWKTSQSDVNLSISHSQNLSGGSNNNDLAYLLSRFGADTDWEAVRLSVDGSYTFKNRWRLHAKLGGQDTQDALIAGEQFGLGGLYSVRGFEEREIAGDRGWELISEVWAPAMDNGLQFYGFIDTGKIQFTTPVPGLAERESITSIGVGAEWNWKKLTADFGWGHVLDDVSGQEDGDHKLHFSMFYRF